MENENNETIIDSTTTNEEEIVLEETTTNEEPKEGKPTESLEDRRARLKRQLEQTEKKLGVTKEEKPSNNAPVTVSTRDLYALMEAKVPEEDISEVEDYAKFRKISISEALRTSTVKMLLAEKAEKRNVAMATNTGAARRSPSKISDDALLSKAQKGDMPETSDEITRLIKARKGLK